MNSFDCDWCDGRIMRESSAMELDERQVRCLRALTQCGQDVFPVNIVRAVRFKLTLSEVMANLDIMEKAGYVASRLVEKRKAFEVTEEGLAAIDRASDDAEQAAAPGGSRPA